MIRSMRRVLVFVLLIALAATVWPFTAHAQVYRWVDERGTPHFAEGIDSVPRQYRGSAMPLGLRNSPAAPSTPATGAPTAMAGAGTEIRFVPGKHILVDARINGGASLKLILDTGAAGTLISPRALAAAGVSLSRGTRTAKTRGVARDVEVEVTQVVVDSLEVGDARVERMVVSSYEMEMGDAEGLLGQDFLGQFNVTIDSSAGVVKLTKK
jgi:predicted aspartyl protease